MSYAALVGLGVDCPSGWSWDATANVCRTSDSSSGCPSGFVEKVPGQCWPSTPTACKEILGTFFNPAEPDRCKSRCPDGMEPDHDHVCRPKSTVTPGVIGMIVLGAVAVAVVFSLGAN